MKTKLLIAAFFIFQIAFSQTSVPGGVVNGTWTLAGSPYNVQGSIQIVNGDSLIIQPGVTVNFTGAYKLLVLGKLKAIGTSTDTIVFTCSNMANRWRGIRFDNTSASNDTSRISYCKIEYGSATGPSPENKGGGIFINNFSKVVVTRSTINNCKASMAGGGLYIVGSPKILSCTVSNDSILNGIGCGICINGSPTILNNLIIANAFDIQFSANGGGIYVEDGSPNIIGNTVTNNKGFHGSGINVSSNTSTIIANNVITNHGTTSAAVYYESVTTAPHTLTNNIISNNNNGGVAIMGSNQITVLVQNNSICNNIGTGVTCYSGENSIIKNNFICNNYIADGPNTPPYVGGAGICCINPTTNLQIIDNVIANNTAPYGGGMLFYSGTPKCINNTIVNNHAMRHGGAIACDNGNPTFTNCIIYGNTCDSSGQQVYLYDEPSDPNFYYCDVEGGSAAFEIGNNFYTGTYQNNINSNPSFVSPSAGAGIAFNGLSANWSLQAGSPCVDAGDPSGTYPSTDIAGNPRVQGLRIDIGAYEGTASVSVAEKTLMDQVSVYPNPVTGIFTIETSHSNNSICQIIDLNGRIVFSESLNEKTTVNVQNLEDGVYTLIVRSDKSFSTKKLIVLK